MWWMVVFSCASRAEQARGGTGSGTGEDRMFWRRRGRAAGRPGRGGDSGPRRPERSEGWCRLLKQISAGRRRRRQSRRHLRRSRKWSRDQAREIVDFPAVPLFLDDGVSNEDEVRIGSNPGTRHSDSDTLEDGQEFYGWDEITGEFMKESSSDHDETIPKSGTFFSHPTKEDADGDGLPDDIEQSPSLADYDDGYKFRTDPNNEDTDGDNIFDLDATIELTMVKMYAWNLMYLGKDLGVDYISFVSDDNVYFPKAHDEAYFLKHEKSKSVNQIVAYRGSIQSWVDNGFEYNIKLYSRDTPDSKHIPKDSHLYTIEFNALKDDINDNKFTITSASENLMYSDDRTKRRTLDLEFDMDGSDDDTFRVYVRKDSDWGYTKFKYDVYFKLGINPHVDDPEPQIDPATDTMIRDATGEIQFIQNHDTDGDGIGDLDEYNLGNRDDEFAGVACPFVKDIFVEVDYMEDFKLSSTVKRLVNTAFYFNPTNVPILLHIDDGNMNDLNGNGGGQIDTEEYVGWVSRVHDQGLGNKDLAWLDHPDNDLDYEVDNINKDIELSVEGMWDGDANSDGTLDGDKYFTQSRKHIFRYCVIGFFAGYERQTGSDTIPHGRGAIFGVRGLTQNEDHEKGGDFFCVWGASMKYDKAKDYNKDEWWASMWMHEFGHTLGLDADARYYQDDDGNRINIDQNDYPSCMRYGRDIGEKGFIDFSGNEAWLTIYNRELTTEYDFYANDWEFIYRHEGISLHANDFVENSDYQDELDKPP